MTKLYYLAPWGEMISFKISKGIRIYYDKPHFVILVVAKFSARRLYGALIISRPNQNHAS